MLEVVAARLVVIVSVVVIVAVLESVLVLVAVAVVELAAVVDLLTVGEFVAVAVDVVVADVDTLPETVAVVLVLAVILELNELAPDVVGDEVTVRVPVTDGERLSVGEMAVGELEVVPDVEPDFDTESLADAERERDSDAVPVAEFDEHGGESLGPGDPVAVADLDRELEGAIVVSADRDGLAV